MCQWAPGDAGKPDEHTFHDDPQAHELALENQRELAAQAAALEAGRLIQKFCTQYHLAGIYSQRDSINPTQSLLWEAQAFLEAERVRASRETP